ncbi:MAG TPA: alcohol dehydrogenase catalytic domain-containing protein [Chloroflexota bacterium]|nr:alcohol dehydrogenase catalytic domain-containing protein [Chloroflexota bacterium]
MRAVMKMEPGPGAKVVTDAPEPHLNEDEVRIKVAAAAICGTDVHLFEWGKSAQDFNPKLPLVMGHECAGIVDVVGSSVKNVKVGDRVSVETHFFDGHCYQCRIGNAHNCLNMGLLGLTWDGVFAEYVKVPANACFPLPESVPLEIGALFEPAGVSVHALQRMGNVAANSALVCGTGPIGLVVIQLLMLFGASKVVALDLNPARRKFAEQLGAIPLDPRQTDVAEFCRREFGRSGGVDVAFETSGASTVLPSLFESVRREGRIVTVGHPGREVPVDIAAYINKKGIVLSGVFGRRIWDTWETLLALVESGRLDLSWLITHRLPFEEFEHGIDLASKDAAKVILHP